MRLSVGNGDCGLEDSENSFIIPTYKMLKRNGFTDELLRNNAKLLNVKFLSKSKAGCDCNVLLDTHIFKQCSIGHAHF